MYQAADSVAEIYERAVGLDRLNLAFKNCADCKCIDACLLLLASLDLSRFSAGQDLSSLRQRMKTETQCF